MSVLDWRELYAQNQAAIAASGIRLPAMTLPTLPATYLAGGDDKGLHHLLNPLREGPPDKKPRRRQAGSRATPRGNPAAGDRALVHVPPGLDPEGPAAVVCMLHGCTQDPATFATATAMNDTADRHGFVVIYPAQPRGRNANRCWNWFLHAHQERGAGEPELIVSTTQHLVARESGQAIDPARVFIAGLSSGGAMALILAACYPDVFAAVAVHSGLPYRSATDLPSAFAVMGHADASKATDGHDIHSAMGRHARPIPSLVVHGTADRTVAPENSRRILAQSMHANHLASPRTEAHSPATPTTSEHTRADGGLFYTRNRWIDDRGALMHESIEVEGLGHAWSGGTPGGSYTDPRGPSATEAIWAFFAQAAPHQRHPHPIRRAP
ncbi:MAG: PHB depolymerase family esterase [Solirubrobacterales bacterium]|nr:PHB depolymerase family esterase [Solirubrobacterales bacterium]